MNFNEKVLNFFKPPEFPENAEKNRKAYVLNTAVLSGLVLVFFLMGANLLRSGTNLKGVYLQSSALILFLVTRYFLFRGAVDFSGFLFLFSGFSILTLSMMTFGTVRAPAFGIYLFLIVISGLVFSFAGMFFSVAGSSLIAAALIWAEQSGLLPQADFKVGMTQWVTSAALFAVTGWLTYSTYAMLKSLLAKTENEIIERKKTELLLFSERRRLSAVLEGTNAGSWEWYVQTGETVFNERWAEIIGYSLAEISPVSVDTWIQFVHPEDYQKSNGLLQRHFRKETDFYECEVRMRHRNGQWVWVFDRGKVAEWTSDGKPYLMSGTHQEITERKNSEEKIRLLLSEKEILLKEVHHRIKNNMNIVRGMLELQAESSESDEVSGALKSAAGRMDSMSVLYDRLYRAESHRSVSVREYISRLADDLSSVYPLKAGLSIETDIMEFSLDSNEASSLGILINELITNSVKYAFTEKESGHIRIKIEKRNGEISLHYSDDGGGIGEQTSRNSGFGFELIRMLSMQLKGKFRVENSGGMNFYLNFSERTYNN
ncbi:MAG TPA: PAS domain-containing protein [Leptospiraceae bacterium]|nr:PAS domain-containing protein [Leptospiraceae bacterium]